MSRQHLESITCPKCGKESKFMIWSSINTVLDPEMKEKVRTGEAFRWECPECGYKSYVDYGTLYHQMEDKLIIYYVPGDKTDTIEALSGHYRNTEGEMIDTDLTFDESYTKRVVGSMNELKEKLMIFDEGLDDHVIELMKLYMTLHLQEGDPELEFEEFLFSKEQDGTRCFAIHLSDGNWAETDYAQSLYDSFEEGFKEIIETDQEMVIDNNWAFEATKKVK